MNVKKSFTKLTTYGKCAPFSFSRFFSHFIKPCTSKFNKTLTHNKIKHVILHKCQTNFYTNSKNTKLM